MTANKIIPVLMCGGSGTRLWPLSRKNYPKQFVLKNKDGLTLFQSALLQFKNSKFQKPLIITNQDYRFIIREQAKEIKVNLEAVILEPTSKNTFATAIVACLYLNNKYPNARAILSPTDHHIDTKKFVNCIFKNEIIFDKPLCLIGTKPKTPNTNLGYIKCLNSSNGIYNISNFIEKPNLIKAKKLIKDNNVYWNTGNFIINPKNILLLAKSFERKTYTKICKSYSLSCIDLDFIRLDEKEWCTLKKISFDYAIVEKAKDIYMVSYNGPWSDLGTFNSFYNSQKKDSKKNYTTGNTILSQTSNSLVMSDPKITTVTHNVDDIAVITEKDTVLVTKLSESSTVTNLITSLSKNFSHITSDKPCVHKPWGSYTNIYEEDNYKVKLLSVKPDESLSYQSHKYRAEHWVVVTGTATIILNGQKINLEKNKSIYIPPKSKHQLMNNKKKLLQLIEVQIGSYLGEDDINRFNDKYSRDKKK